MNGDWQQWDASGVRPVEKEAGTMGKRLGGAIALAVLLLALAGSIAITNAAPPLQGGTDQPGGTPPNPPIVVTGVTEVLPLPKATVAPIGRTWEFTAASGVTKTLSLPRVTIAQAGTVTATLSEDFESDWPAPGWEVWDQSGSDGGEYLWGRRDCHPHTGSFAGWAVGGGAQGSALGCSDHYPNNADTWAVYGPFDLSNAYTATLTFHLWGRTEESNFCSHDSLFVSGSADKQTWSGFAYCGDWTDGDAGNGYYRQTLDLSEHSGKREVWIGFAFSSNDSTTDIGFTVDDITLDVWYRQSNVMHQDFEDEWPAAGWRVTDPSDGDGGEYLWGKRDCHPHTGSFAGWSVGGGAQGSALACGANHPNNARSWAIYGPFDLGAATDASLTFHLWGQTVGEFGCAGARLFVGSSTNGTDFSGSNYCGDWTSGGTGNGYYRQTLDLSNQAGKKEVWVGFAFISYSDTMPDGFIIDDVDLTSSGPSPSFNLVWTSTEEDETETIAWGDYDGDGDLDLAVGNSGYREPNRLYRNDGGTLTAGAVWSSDEGDDTYSVAWGDYDGDGDLDLAAGNDGRERLYRNDGVGTDGTPKFTLVWTSAESGFTQGLAWGDYDGDGDLDLAVESQHDPIRVYRNDGGMLTANAVWETTETGTTCSVAWGDYDGDGDLDLVVGDIFGPPRLYRNDGGTLTTEAVWSPLDGDGGSVAWGDYDSDGDLDLAAGPWLYRNDGGTLTSTAVWTPNDGGRGETVWIDYDSDDDLDLAVGTRLYRNDSGILAAGAAWSWADGDSMAWGDYDDDGDLDLAVGRTGRNRLYRNDGNLLTASSIWSSTEADHTNSVAWGDYDNDGDLDLAVGNYWGPANRLYRNDGGMLTTSAVWSSEEGDWTNSVAWGDYDGDGDLDLAVGNTGDPHARLYRNNGGMLTTSAVWSSTGWDDTQSIAWGDYDGDGDLDLAVGNNYGPIQLYRNDGGILTTGAVWLSAEWDDTQSVAWGDYDGDGDLDLVARNYRAPNRLYRNDQGMLTTSAVWLSAGADDSNVIGGDAAWGDYDGDGDLDLAMGHTGGPTRLYRNDGGALTTETVWSPFDAGGGSLAWGDYDGDGDLDLAVGSNGFYDLPSRLYRNDRGTLTPKTIWFPSGGGGDTLAWGDYDGDGDLDLAMGNSGAPNLLYRNRRDHYTSPASIPILAIAHPDRTASANFYSSSQVWTESIMPITYTLFHRESDPVREVRGFYSLNGGGQWLPAIATSDTITTNLASGPYPTDSLTNTHVYKWDIYASGLMGQYDNVVFRLVAIPAIAHKPNDVAGPYQYGSYAATTFPFRVRGSQVRVLSGTVPISNALVYRLPAGQTSGGTFYADASDQPFRTDGQGYLRGHGEIRPGDRLLALAPVPLPPTYTQRYSDTLHLYYTNGAPTETGLDAFTVTQPGVQTLTVSADNPLLLFDLYFSLEWDAHNDPSYLQQLEFDLEQASRHLYDFTNGRAALGRVTVSQNGEDWDIAHVVVHASNRLRPFAAQGGVIVTPTVDLQHDNIVYDIGQVRMSATWNRYGTPGQSLGVDWPLALAHELSHYLLFLDDTYLGLNDDGLLIPVDTCTGSAMGDVYAPDNTEFVYDESHWDNNCATTLANRTLARTEWETIGLWYPWLNIPSLANPGPSVMPFDLTTIHIFDPLTPTHALADPTFYLDYAGGGIGSSKARAFLLRDQYDHLPGYDYLIDLGSPVGGQNRVLARGAQPGDRLCVFDQPRRQYGCEVIREGDDRLALVRDNNWTPLIQLSPVTSQTLGIRVGGLPAGLTIRARLYPEYQFAGQVITLSETNGTYNGTFELDWPALVGHVQVWDEGTGAEVIVDYAIGGNPGGGPASRSGGPASRSGGPASRSGGPASRSGGPASRSGGAPLVSSDGQMIFFTENPIAFNEGELYTVQSMAGLPPLPPGKTGIGQSYNLTVSPNVIQVVPGSISFRYLGTEALAEGVSEAGEAGLTIHFWDGSRWRTLETVRDTYHNLASAPSQGPGVYALLAGVTTPHIEAVIPSAATNDVTTTLVISGGYFLEPVEVALVGPSGTYSLPVVAVSPVSVTAVVTQGLPAREYQVLVVNGNQPGEAAVSPTPGTFALYEPAQACFYDFFESGAGKWQRDGDWDIAILPGGERAMTDSPAGNYDSAIPPAITYTTSITSQAFDLSSCTNPTLTFRHDYVLARVGSSQDVARVEISTDGGATWAELARYSGGGIFGEGVGAQDVESPEWTNVSWKKVEIGLGGYTGMVRLRFSLEVDQYVSDKGWIIDDVMVRSGSGGSPPGANLFLPIILKNR